MTGNGRGTDHVRVFLKALVPGFYDLDDVDYAALGQACHTSPEDWVRIWARRAFG